MVWELRQATPLLDIRLFRDRGLAAGSVTLLVVFAVMFGLFLVLIQFLQAVLGYSALRRVGRPAADGRRDDAAVDDRPDDRRPRSAPRRTLLTGVGRLRRRPGAAGRRWSSVDGGYLSILPGLLVLGVGIGLCDDARRRRRSPSRCPHEKQGVASALNDTVRELGGAVGIALLGSVLSSGYRSSVSSTADRCRPSWPAASRTASARRSPVAGELGADATTVVTRAREAFVDGWRTSLWVGVVLAAIGFAYVAIRGPARPTAPVPEVEMPEGALEAELVGASLTCKRGQPRRPIYANDTEEELNGCCDVRLTGVSVVQLECHGRRLTWS